MSYTALYRKYRPRSFEDVIGQDHIVKTLTNQIEQGKVSHAYLFTGSRGTGKTTCAKIFAQAVNCEKPINGSPCGKCSACKAIDDPSNIDVLEIDAASNNKVDEIREIRERVKYLPVSGKYKVYIIDEVHMLTDSAFNALLKTLEEPPSHVIFILATTEVHKLPATILSRCMRFDFRLVSVAKLSENLQKIYNKEKKKAEDEAINYIATLAEGSVRDSLSIADMCLNYSSGELKYADVLSVLGATDKGKIAKLFSHIKDGDIANTLTEIDSLATSGKSMSLIAKDIVSYARDLLAIKAGGENMVSVSSERLQQYKEDAQNYATEFLVCAITEFSKIDAELRYSVSPRIVLEITAIRTGRLSGDDPFMALARLKRLEERLDSGQFTITAGKQEQNTAVLEKNSQEKSEKKNTEILDARTIWGRMITHFRRAGEGRIFTLLGESVEFSISGDTLVICGNETNFLQFNDAEVFDKIQAFVKSEFGCNVEIVKKAGEIDMDKEIQKVKKLVGDSGIPVNVLK